MPFWQFYQKSADWLDWPALLVQPSISAHRKWQEMVVSASTNEVWTKITIRTYARSFAFQIQIQAVWFSSHLVLPSKLDLHGVFFMCPHINSVNRGMPVLWNYQFFSVLLTNMIQFNLFATGRFQKLEQNLNPMTAFREQFKMGQKIAAELAKLAVLFGW